MTAPCLASRADGLARVSLVVGGVRGDDGGAATGCCHASSTIPARGC